MNRPILTVPVQKISADSAASFQDLLAVEEPLEIRLGAKPVSITMRTPGNDFELAAGFLFTEGILHDAAEIREIRWLEPANNGNPRQLGNSVTVELHPGVEVDLDRLERHFYTTSSCGVCGKASIEALQTQGCPVLPRDGPRIAAAAIHRLPETLRREQAVFERTGGLHAAALFDPAGNLQQLREDIGRHNAVDKIIGAEMLAGRTPLSDRLLFVSSRASFELVQKALMAGIPILAAVGAPSSLAVETAQRFNMTLLGFVRDSRFNIYSGASRIQ
ncbi:MAG TPA: formate dehydrogenase accessory sulfurtransferase FdhD [Bryobacteraceae bacterium]|nr:formate dehydrogenase accessory sulfurtransferase FdhD [Bryobacteraceae bacterium]